MLILPLPLCLPTGMRPAVQASPGNLFMNVLPGEVTAWTKPLPSRAGKDLKGTGITAIVQALSIPVPGNLQPCALLPSIHRKGALHAGSRT